MKKLNLYFICASESQTFNMEKEIKKLNKLYKFNFFYMPTTLTFHFFMLSKHFNLKNFYSYTKEEIIEDKNAIIYHLPYGLNKVTGVEGNLKKIKGKVPIIFRSYDPHSPIKTSKDYMLEYHDFILTYFKERVNNKNIQFSYTCYDNFLLKNFKLKKNKNTKFISMILRKRKGLGYREKSSEFSKNGLDLTKTYDEREKIIKNDKVEVYGTGWEKKYSNYKGMLYPHDRKYDILASYKYSIITENAVTNLWLSEKILDAFLSDTIPIYLGSKKTNDHISEGMFIDIHKFNSINETIDFTYNEENKDYEKRINLIKKEKFKLFEKFSTENSFSKKVYSFYNLKNSSNFGLSQKEYDKITSELAKIKIIRLPRFISLVLEKINYYLD